MGVFVNTAMLRTTSTSSDALDVLGTIIHPVPVGDYGGEVWRGKTRLSTFTLSVAKEDQPSSVQVDLETLAGPRSSGSAPKFRATGTDQSPGYVVFHVSSGEGGFHVLLTRGGKTVHDTRQLSAGDMFAATLVRPGSYDMAAGKTRQGKIEVKNLQARAELRREFATGNVKVTAAALEPKAVEVEAGDSVVFNLMAAATVSVAFKGPKSGKTRRPARPVRIYASGAAAAAEPPTTDKSSRPRSAR
jgi:hypothetical protein